MHTKLNFFPMCLSIYTWCGWAKKWCSENDCWGNETKEIQESELLIIVKKHRLRTTLQYHTHFVRKTKMSKNYWNSCFYAIISHKVHEVKRLVIAWRDFSNFARLQFPPFRFTRERTFRLDSFTPRYFWIQWITRSYHYYHILSLSTTYDFRENRGMKNCSG